MSGFRFQVSGFRCQVSDVRCQVPAVRCQVSDVRCQVSGVRCQVSGVRCQVSGVSCRSDYLKPVIQNVSVFGDVLKNLPRKKNSFSGSGKFNLRPLFKLIF